MNKDKYKHVRLLLSKEQRIIFNKITLLSQNDIALLWEVFQNVGRLPIDSLQEFDDWYQTLRIYIEDKPIDQLYKEQNIGQTDALNL